MASERQDHRPEPARRDRLIQEHVHDPYMLRLKLPDPGVCERCHAVYEHGRWRWGPRPAVATAVVCPACHRVADRCPAGVVTLSGAYVGAHRDELLALIHHHLEQENAEHPMNRIMDIRDTGDGLEVTTTDVHLPRGIGEALRRNHRGHLTLHFDEGECFARVRWQAD